MHYLVERNTLHLKYAKSGRTKLENLKKNLYVTLPVGTSLYKIDIESVSGSIVVDCNATEIDVESVSGNVNVNGNANEIDVDSVSGNVDIKGSASKIDVNSVSGKVDIVCSANLIELDAETVSGNINLLIPETKGFALEYETVSGLFYNAFSNQPMSGKYYTYLGGGCSIDVETVSGDLRIEKQA